MTVLHWIVGILLLISALVMIVTVLLQSSERSGLGAISGAAETFFGKNKAKGMDAKLALITKICAIVFVVLSIGMMFLGLCPEARKRRSPAGGRLLRACRITPQHSAAAKAAHRPLCRPRCSAAHYVSSGAKHRSPPTPLFREWRV